MPDYLEKPAHVQAPGGLWGTFNTSNPALTSSPDGYLLTMAPSDIARLDDFTPAQERAFWDFTFAQAGKGTDDKTQRGHDTVPDDAPAHCVVMCALNDGPAAWQAVGSVHGHVIWLKEAAAPADIQEKITSDRARIVGHDYQPLGTISVDLSQPGYSDDIRAARSLLRENFASAVAGDDVGFSLYTKKASAGDPRKDGTMIVEAWTRAHNALASLSGFVRSWTNPNYPSPVSPHEMGYKYQGFKPEMK